MSTFTGKYSCNLCATIAAREIRFRQVEHFDLQSMMFSWYKATVASESMEISALLKTCALFRGFSEPGLLVISRIAIPKKIPEKTPIFVQNMVADAMYIVQMGVVELSLRSSQGKEIALSKLTTGETFGELSLLVGGHRLVTATAATDCELLEINRRQFANLQKQKPQACLKLILNIMRCFGERLYACRNHFTGALLSGIRSMP